MSKHRQGYTDLVNDYFSINHKDVAGLNNSSYFFYQNYLFTLVKSIFKFENLPVTWDEDYLKDILFQKGYVCVAKMNDIGSVALEGGYFGINMFSKPTHIQIDNPVLNHIERQIGVDGELLYMNYINRCYMSFYPIVKRYALILSQIDGSLNTSLMNSRVAHVFMANSNAQLKSMQKIYDDVSAGKPAVFYNNQANDGFETQNTFMNVKNTFIGNELLNSKRTIINEFLTTIGINNANTSKRERLNSDEVNANNNECMAYISVVKDTVDRCLKKINKMLETDIRFNYNYEVIRKVSEEYELN